MSHTYAQGIIHPRQTPPVTGYAAGDMGRRSRRQLELRCIMGAPPEPPARVLTLVGGSDDNAA